MICNDALKLLTKMDENRGKRIELDPHELLVLGELEQKGYVSKVKLDDFDPEEYAKAKSELQRLQNDPQKSMKELDILALQEQKLRERILMMSELAVKKDRSISVNGINYSISYKGKESIENLIPRIKRVGNKQMEEFEKEMSLLDDAFASWAKRSLEILQNLSPRTPEIDEIHCRCVVVGLSSRPETAREVSDAFLYTLQSLGMTLTYRERFPFVAECIIIGAKDLSKTSISSAVSKYNDLFVMAEKVVSEKYATNYDAATDCALLMYPFERSSTDNELLISSALDFAMKIDIMTNLEVRFEAALLIELMGLELNDEIARKFKKYYEKLSKPMTPEKNAGIAAALLVIGISEGQDVDSRFTTVLEYLGQFSEESMIIPAAMLSHLSPEIEETLDTLRLASYAIARQKLSLGGMENLSLGMKMLLQSSVITSLISIPPELRKEYVVPHEMIPLQTLGILSLSMLPAALTAFTAFHELSIHKLTVSDYGFHPVHVNFSYG